MDYIIYAKNYWQDFFFKTILFAFQIYSGLIFILISGVFWKQLHSLWSFSRRSWGGSCVLTGVPAPGGLCAEGLAWTPGAGRQSPEVFFSLFFFLLKYTYLQCCANFCFTAKWLSYTHIYILFYNLFHYGLSQEIGYISLCATVGPCCLSILNVIVCIH